MGTSSLSPASTKGPTRRAREAASEAQGRSAACCPAAFRACGPSFKAASRRHGPLVDGGHGPQRTRLLSVLASKSFKAASPLVTVPGRGVLAGRYLNHNSMGFRVTVFPSTTPVPVHCQPECGCAGSETESLPQAASARTVTVSAGIQSEHRIQR